MPTINPFVIYLVVINCVTFAVFGLDKQRAIRHEWRIRESTLLGLSLAGGSFGGMLAMQVFRHKTQKPLFKYGLPAITAAQVMLLGWITGTGRA